MMMITAQRENCLQPSDFPKLYLNARFIHKFIKGMPVTETDENPVLNFRRSIPRRGKSFGTSFGSGRRNELAWEEHDLSMNFFTATQTHRAVVAGCI
jgi:hypothetical protein